MTRRGVRGVSHIELGLLVNHSINSRRASSYQGLPGIVVLVRGKVRTRTWRHRRVGAVQAPQVIAMLRHGCVHRTALAGAVTDRPVHDRSMSTSHRATSAVPLNCGIPNGGTPPEHAGRLCPVLPIAVLSGSPFGFARAVVLLPQRQLSLLAQLPPRHAR